MTWQLGPVLRGIRGHRAAAALVVVQLAVGLAITVLAVLIGDYFIEHGHRSEAVSDELSVVEVYWAGRSAGGESAAARRADVLAQIRRASGVTDATQLPMPLRTVDRTRDDVRAGGSHASVAEMTAGARIVAVTGLHLAAGRDFTAEDLSTPGVTAAIVTPSLASTVWRGQNPIGATFQSRAHGAAVVVGVAELDTILFGTEPLGVLYAGDKVASPRMTVLVRSDAARAAAVRASLAELLQAPEQHVVVSSAHAVTRRFTRPTLAVLGILGTMVGAIVIVIVIGSTGLTYFLVSARTREIGVRRALGARQRDVVRYFVLENVVLTSAGVLLGLAIMAIVLPALFHEQSGFVIDWALVAVTIASVVLLNLIATMIPARRAAAVPPVVASRTV